MPEQADALIKRPPLGVLFSGAEEPEEEVLLPGEQLQALKGEVEDLSSDRWCKKARISGLPDHQTGVGFSVGFLDFCCFSEEGYVLPLNDARSKIPSYVASGCAPLPGQCTSYTKHRQVALTSSGLTQQNARA